MQEPRRSLGESSSSSGTGSSRAPAPATVPAVSAVQDAFAGLSTAAGAEPSEDNWATFD